MKYKIVLIAILASIFVGCNHDHKLDQDRKDEHDQEEIKNQFTVYTDEFELFAEADPFVVGKTSNVLSHFTNLPHFTALENGSITIRLIVRGTESIQTLDKPSRKGVYSFRLKPENDGIGKLLFDIETVNGEFQVVVPDVRVYSNEHDAIHFAEDTRISVGISVFFSKEQSWKTDFSTEYPHKGSLGHIIKTTASIKSAPSDEVIVTSMTNGVVKHLIGNVLEGSSISEGQVLFSISGTGLADDNSQVRFLEAENNYEKTKLDYERAKELARDKIVSEKDLLIAKNQYNNAKLVYDNLAKNFDLSGQLIKSPINGFVKNLFVQNGQYVQTGQSIVSISQNKILLLEAEVQQKYSSLLGKINSANIRTLAENKTYTLEQLNGKIISYGRSTNRDNYMIPISLQIENPGSFVSGGFVEVYLKSMTNTQAIAIPNSAILEEQGVYFVFVQITPELFEKREVEIGVTDGLKTEILKGISENDRIVVKGAILIKLAQATGGLDAHSGHVH